MPPPSRNWWRCSRRCPVSARAVVLRAEGPHFCAGLTFVEHGQSERSPAEFMRICLRWHEAFNKIEYGGILVTAALRARSSAAGWNWHPRSISGPRTKPPISACPRGSAACSPAAALNDPVPQLIGKARMIDMMLTGRLYSGDEAVAVGMAAIPRPRQRGQAYELARACARNTPLSNFAICSGISHMQNMSGLGCRLCRGRRWRASSTPRTRPWAAQNFAKGNGGQIKPD